MNWLTRLLHRHVWDRGVSYLTTGVRHCARCDRWYLFWFNTNQGLATPEQVEGALTYEPLIGGSSFGIREAPREPTRTE